MAIAKTTSCTMAKPPKHTKNISKASAKHIYIVGMMGCGKTSFGRKLARSINYPLIDTDTYIYQTIGKSITTIFEEKGADAFRKIEHEAILTLSRLPQAHVISTGGGLPCYHNNMDVLLKTGYSIYLKAEVPFLYSRLKKNQQKRPLIADKSKSETFHILHNILQERHPIYSKATLTVNAISATPASVLQILQQDIGWEWEG